MIVVPINFKFQFIHFKFHQSDNQFQMISLFWPYIRERGGEREGREREGGERGGGERERGERGGREREGRERGERERGGYVVTAACQCAE